MYYSNGNYEAFARPLKPEGVDNKTAWLVGSGLASLSAACFLIRDGQMKGENIHILEELKLPGGACDGIQDQQLGFVIRGGRVCGTCFAPFHPSKLRMFRFWTNITG